MTSLTKIRKSMFHNYYRIESRETIGIRAVFLSILFLFGLYSGLTAGL